MQQQAVRKRETVEDERSLGDLFAELADESSALIKQEVALAQAELSEKATRAGINIGYLVVGGSIAFVAFQTLIASLILGLGSLIGNYWLPALIVGVLIAAVAYFLVSSALEALKDLRLTPQQTRETLEEDAKWIKEQIG